MRVVAGRVLPDKEHIVIALMSIYGVGKSRAIYICKKIDLRTDTKVKDMQEVDLNKIREILSTFIIEGDLRREVATCKKSLQMMGSYRGVRSRRGLPSRGQRTRTNAQTAKRLRRRT